jgi:hypothetical protein
MNISSITHTIVYDSEIKNVTIGVFQKTINLVHGLFRTIKQGMTEIDASRQDHQNKQQQVYRYSIDRMNKLEKLQMGLHRD